MRRRWHGARFVMAVAACLLLCAASGWAQDVRQTKSGFGTMRRQADKIAEKENRTDWPRIDDDDKGTQIHVSSSIKDADIVVMTDLSFPLPHLLTEAKDIAGKLDLPKADFITFQGSKSSNVDIELNDYLVRNGNKDSHIEIDLTRLAAALRDSPLPRPIGVYIDRFGAESATLTDASHPSGRVLGEGTPLRLEEIAPDARLRFVSTVPWYGYPMALFMVGMVTLLPAFAIALPWWAARRLRKEREKETPSLDPAVVQERYNRQKPLWFVTGAFPLLLIALGFLVDIKRLMKAGTIVFSLYWPFDDPPNVRYMMLATAVMGFLMVGSMGLQKWMEKRRTASEPAPPLDAAAPHPDDVPAQWTQMGFLMVLMTGMIVMPLFLFFPLKQFDSMQRVLIIFGVEAVIFVAAALVGMRGARANRTELGPDSDLYRTVHTMADKAGVRVRHVVVTRSPQLNASASLFGTVGVTSALLRKMEPEEIRVLIAHELGHLKADHVKKSLLLALPLAAGYFALLFGVIPLLKGHVSDLGYSLLRSPLLGMAFGAIVTPLFLGRNLRRREEEADAFAVQMTGDREFVIQTLRKLHTLNATPFQLKASDEALSSHPSLAHRIDAIRRL